jgi:hypothetical protein
VPAPSTAIPLSDDPGEADAPAAPVPTQLKPRTSFRSTPEKVLAQLERLKAKA